MLLASIAGLAIGTAGTAAFVYRRAQKFSDELDAGLARFHRHLEARPDLTRGIEREQSGRLVGEGLQTALIRLRADPETQSACDFVVGKGVEYRRAAAATRWLIRHRACVADYTSFSLATLAAVEPLLETFATELACVWPLSATDPRAGK